MASALFAAPALAASPAEIAQDLQDGRLDGSYSQADLQAYLESAIAQGYGNPVETPVTPAAPVTPASAVTPASPVTPAAPASGVAGVATPVVTPAAPGSSVAGVSTPATPTVGVAGVQKSVDRPLAATRRVGTLPFTGVDLALLVIGGSLLLLLGLGARRAGRARA